MKRTDKYVASLAVVVFLMGSFYILLYKDSANESNTGSVSLFSYTREEVAAHDSGSSCWSIVGDQVYDLTSWINNHPGGAEAILWMCGKDATFAFNTQHAGQENPLKALRQHNIGILK